MGEPLSVSKLDGPKIAVAAGLGIAADDLHPGGAGMFLCTRARWMSDRPSG